MYSVLKNSDKIVYGVKQFLIDTEAELGNIKVSACRPGTVALVAENSKKFILNNNKQWVEWSGGAGGSSSGGECSYPTGDVIYDGGEI